MKQNRRSSSLALILALATLIGAALVPGALASGGIFVNNSSAQLTGELGEAYAIGGDGSVSVIAGTPAYAMTGSGLAPVGGTPPPVLPPESYIKVKTAVARVGLYYYYSASRDSSLESAVLTNYVGSGFRLGYYDSARQFHELTTTGERELTFAVEDGNVVARAGDSLVLASDSSFMLAAEPIATGTKGVTSLSGSRYYGGFEFRTVQTDRVTVVNVLPLEDYIKGVVPYEMSPSWPKEALKAQALCARTYYMTSYNLYSSYGFDVTDDTYCQAYMGVGGANAATDSAVDETAGLYVTYGGRLASTYYFSSDGGATESSENVWVTVLPYLRGKPDPYEAAIEFKFKTWSFRFTAEQLTSKLKARGYPIGEIVSVTPKFTEAGNVFSLTYEDTDGKTLTLSKSSAYTSLGLYSCHFDVSRDGDYYDFDGGGWGHNVGMSQWGAYSMAKVYGMSFREIIGFYFTGVDISTGILG